MNYSLNSRFTQIGELIDLSQFNKVPEDRAVKAVTKVTNWGKEVDSRGQKEGGGGAMGEGGDGVSNDVRVVMGGKGRGGLNRGLLR